MNRSTIKHGLLLLLIVFCIVTNFAGFMGGVDWGDDFAGYIIQSKTLVNGNYKALEQNMSQNDFLLNYPWGFPIILTPVINHFDANPTLIKKYVFLFFVLGLAFAYLLFRRRNKEQALIAVLLVAASPYFWYFKNYIFADFPNLCFILISLLLIEKLVVKKETLINQYLDSCLLGVMVFISFIIRTQSIVLLITLAAMQLFYWRKELVKKRNLIAGLIPYLLFMGLKISVEAIIPIKAVSYLNAYNNTPILNTVWNNIFYYLNIWKELFKDIVVLRNIEGLVTGASILIFFIGISIKFRENILYIVFIAGSISLLLITPFYQGLRYLIPIIPIFFYFFVVGVFQIADAFYQNKGPLIANIFLGLFFIFSFFSLASLSYSTTKTAVVMEGPYSPSAIKLFDFLKSNTPGNSKICFWKPRAMLLYSGRNGVISHDYDECLKKNAGFYVYYRNAYVDQISLDSITSHPTLFKNIFDNYDFKVYKITPNSSLYAHGKELSDTINEGELVKTINYEYFESSVMSGTEKVTGLWSNDSIRSKNFKLEKGKYRLSILSSSTKAAGVFPLNNIILNGKSIALYYGQEEVSLRDFPFEINNDTELSIKLKLENDLNENGEDRNTLIYFINIYKAK